MLRDNTKFSPLRFGTSGIRGPVVDMTDMECYINTRGFIRYLYNAKEIVPGGSIALAGDLRSSTPRIMKAAHQAILDEGYQTLFCGFVPTPVLSFYAWKRHLPSVMVTGSHIPDDLNGIKFIKSKEEVLKSDEKDILSYVAETREAEYSKDESDSLFDVNGMFKKFVDLPGNSEEKNALQEFEKRYTNIFPPSVLAGKKIVLYEQSAVGRDLFKNVLTSLGAEVICFGRSDEFIPIDTEKMPDSVMALLKDLANEFKPFAVVSADGDSDRPILADENGVFLSGDLLGTLVSFYLKPDFVSLPITSNDAAVIALKKLNIEVVLTKVGSPYCVASMKEKLKKDPNARVVSWEKNGGYLLGSDFLVNGKTLSALPTRDSILPILVALVLSVRENVSLSTMISSRLPKRFTVANAIDNKTKGCESYSAELGKVIIRSFSPQDINIEQLNFDHKKTEIISRIPVAENSNIEKEALNIKSKLESYFSHALGYSEIVSINYIDGVRISFSDGDVVHLRPSSNAPEFRFYATADSEDAADKILADRLRIMPLIITDAA